MSEFEVKTTTDEVTSTTPVRPRKRGRKRLQFLAITTAATAAAVVCVRANYAEMRQLAADTRVVVRFPKAVFAELTQDEIREEFPILEQAGEMEVTGNAVATGHVSIEIERDTLCPSDSHAVIAVRVVGVTEKSLVGRQSGVEVLGTGHGQFDAVKRIHFDGRQFSAEEPTIVEATHETEIDDVQTSVGGPFRLLASRKVRQAVPKVNELAIGRIQERVGERVDEIVAAALTELNHLNQFDDAIARLHPSSDNWRIQVVTDKDFIEAALIPAGGHMPELPRGESSSVEVWMRLTSSERIGMGLLNQWHQSYRLLSGFVPDEQAKALAEELSVADVDDWMRVRVAAASLLKRDA